MLSSTVNVSVLTVVCVPFTVKLPESIKSLVNVLAPPIFCVPVVLTTVLSTVISSALAVIPSPPITFSVKSPELPPPVSPVPAVTPVTSPTLSASIVKVPAPSSYVAVIFAPPTINAATLSSTRSF